MLKAKWEAKALEDLEEREMEENDMDITHTQSNQERTEGKDKARGQPEGASNVGDHTLRETAHNSTGRQGV